MRHLKVSALFAGIGGVELGLGSSNHQTEFLCEFDPAAQQVLKARFPEVPIHGDVRDLKNVPKATELLTAGFPCQDLSQAGETRGIEGANSGLVGEVFRILTSQDIPNLLLENVPFMLQLERGRAMRTITAALEQLGYKWAYRVLDSRAFGVPQRRQRVFVLASKNFDPSELLFQEDHGPPDEKDHRGVACGFYWTEGVRGLGWAVDAIPTLKGGSTIGIPSPPAIWFPDGRIAKPDLRDAERLQGFRSDWTAPAELAAKESHRWKLVGNAVSVHAARWVGRTLHNKPKPLTVIPTPFDEYKSWPTAAYGSSASGRYAVPVSMWPVCKQAKPLEEFLRYEPTPLSHRAVSGFIKRLKKGNLRYKPEFFSALTSYEETVASSTVM